MNLFPFRLLLAALWLEGFMSLSHAQSIVAAPQNEPTSQPSAVAPTTQQVDGDFAHRVRPHIQYLRLAIKAASDGNYPIAIGVMEYLIDKAPDVPEFRDIASAYRTAYQAEIAATIKKNNNQQRPRLTLDQLPLTDRIRARLLMKRMSNLGQIDPSQRNAQAAELLNDVKKFTLDQPNFARGWLMQASLCLNLDQPLLGNIAARNLAELRAQESVDPKVQALLHQLQNKGWFPGEIKLLEATPSAVAK